MYPVFYNNYFHKLLVAFRPKWISTANYTTINKKKRMINDSTFDRSDYDEEI